MKLIINADDFGMSETVNAAIVDGFKNGILTSTCIMANMPAFENAIELLQEIDGIGLGVHLNIIEHETILEKPDKYSKLYDKNGNFNNGFLQMILKSYDEDFMLEVEQEFRTQIEAVMKHTKPDHLDSHVHIHGIPRIFELVCKLAKEYEIPCVRTQYEYPYYTTNHNDLFNLKYYLNLVKIAILNTFTFFNHKTARKYGIITNDCVIGVGYTSMMDKNTIECGINRVKNTNKTLEVICHPDLNQKRKSNNAEYKAVVDEDLKKFLKTFECIRYGSLIQN